MSSLNRRQFLAGATALGLSSSLAVAPLWAQSRSSASSLQGGRLVVVFLRGAYDGLSAFVPYADPEYAQLRRATRIAAPDGTAQTALDLDGRFGMHPALSPLLPLWNSQQLAVIPAAGSPDPTRSHFEAQYMWEIGQTGRVASMPGWMNRLAGLDAAAVRDDLILGVGETNPAILAGPSKARLIPRGQAATNTGVLANERTRNALMDLYKGDDAIARGFREGSQSRMASARELAPADAAAMNTQMSQREAVAAAQRNMAGSVRPDGRLRNNVPDRQRRQVAYAAGSDAAMDAQAQSGMADMSDVKLADGRSYNAVLAAANNGAPSVQGLALDARHLTTLMKNDPSLRLGFLSAGGWDTHANQGGVTGQLANNLGNLANALAVLREQFNQPGDLIMVMSEFGRTAAENGTGGTDHGHGNALWLIGDRVNGGRIHGQWNGLARGNLNENRDLPVLHDFRSVIAQGLRASFGLSDSRLAEVFPALRWDRQLDGLMRRSA
jgi:uncharacterized protein (DUF1501 family)